MTEICFFIGLFLVINGNNAGFIVMFFGLLLDD